MSTAADERAAFGRAIERTDYLRTLPPRRRAGAAHREWLHFVLRGDDVDVLVNFSVLELLAGGARRLGGRLVLLVRDRRTQPARWDGDVDAVAPARVDAGAGRLRLALGDATLDFDGRFHLRARCRRRDVSVDLAIEPRAHPYLVPNFQLGGLARGALDDGAALHWLVVPRLATTGLLRHGGRAVPLAGAPTYHDHNWGAFDGRHLAWEWACTLAAGDAGGVDGGPWSAVLVRLLDRARATTLARGLVVWEGANRRRVFRSGEVRVAAEGLLRPAEALRVPRALALLAQGAATDVPARLAIAADSDGDRLAGALHCEDLARVLVPRDDDLGTTALHEVGGRLVLDGVLGGRALRIDAPAFAEFVAEAA